MVQMINLPGYQPSPLMDFGPINQALHMRQQQQARADQMAMQERQQAEQSRQFNAGHGLAQNQDAQAAALAPIQRRQMMAQAVAAERPPTTNDITEYEFARRNGFTGGFADFQKTQHANKQGVGNVPIMGVGPDGKTAVMRLGPNGLEVAAAPAGYLADPRGAIKIDTGTGTQVVTQGGRTVANIDRNTVDRESDEQIGKAKGTFIANITKLESQIQSLVEQNRLLAGDGKEELGEIGKAQQLATSGRTGWQGAAAKYVPGTPAFVLAQHLNTIKANIGFDRLQQMRQESPTGGALGAIAVQELQWLQSVLGSFDQGQDDKTLHANLQRLKGILAGSEQSFKDAFAKDLQRFTGATPQPAGGQQSPPGFQLPPGYTIQKVQ